MHQHVSMKLWSFADSLNATWVRTYARVWLHIRAAQHNTTQHNNAEHYNLRIR